MKVELLQEHEEKFNSTGSTGFLSIDAKLLHDCPRCNAEKGYYCKTPKGRTTYITHGERIRMLTTEQSNRCRIPVVPNGIKALLY